LQPLSASQREALEEATSSYAGAVTAEAARYLLARGIDRDTAATFRLGVVGDPFPGHERFRGWLAIPYLDREGKPLSMRFRCITEHNHRDFGHGKYMSMTDEPSRVFNVRGIHLAEDTLHVAEGEFDTMILSRVFGGCASGFPGARSWSGHHRRMLAGFSKVYVWGDPDEAGAEFVQKVTRAVRTAKGVRLRGGDVTDTYVAGGADALHALITPREEDAA
jgi:DNA primase